MEPVSREEFAEQQAAWNATKERGRPPRWRAVEFVVAGHHIIEQKPDDAKRWAAGVKEELLRIYPSVKWQAVALHADETSWHVHAFGQPWGKDAKGKLRRGKAAMLREAESVLLERPIRKASLTPKQLSVFGGKFQQHMDAKLGQPFGMTPITPGGKETSRKRDEKMDIIERRLAYAREREELADQRGIESNAKAERREAEALANAAQIEREAKARVDELERQADEAAAKRDHAVNADIEAIVNQSLPIKLRPRAHIRNLERKVAELEGEIERLKDANEQEADRGRPEDRRRQAEREPLVGGHHREGAGAGLRPSAPLRHPRTGGAAWAATERGIRAGGCCISRSPCVR